MRPSWKNVAVPALSLALVQCDSATGPQLADFLLAFCADETPDFVAIKNDGGAWTPVAMTGASTTVKVSPKFGVAAVHDFGFSFETVVHYGTASELATLSTGTCQFDIGTKAINGSVSGLSSGQYAQVGLGSSTQLVFTNDAPFQWLEVEDGALDLVGMRRTSNGTPDRVIVRRGLNQANGSTIPVLNFGDAEAVAPASATLTLTGAGSDYIGYDVDFVTANGTSENFDQFNIGTSPISLAGVPAVLTQPNDRHVIRVFASNGPAIRGVLTANRDLASSSVAVGPAMSMPTITSTGSPVVWRAQFASQAAYGSFAAVEFSQFTSSSSRYVLIMATSAYFGGTPPAMWDLQAPSFTGLAGYPTGASLTSGTAEWNVSAADISLTTFNGGAGIPDGTVAKFATVSSSEGPGVRAGSGSSSAVRASVPRGFARNLQIRR